MKITLKQVNAEIAKEFPHVFLVRGNGYYYIATDDNQTGSVIGGFYTTSISVPKLNMLTIEQWVSNVRHLMTQVDGRRVYC